MFELAYNLKKFVWEVEDMPYTEFVEWQGYFEKRPIGWRDDDRTLKLLQAQGVKAKGHELFESLAQIKKASEANVGDSNTRGLKTSVFYQMMMNAVGGDKLK